MLSILKLYDKPGWAYDFIAREMARYSKNQIKSVPYNDFSYDHQDIVLISGPNIEYHKTAIEIPKECKKRGIKVIGQYCGEVNMAYHHADLIVTISPQLYLFAKEKYKDTGIPVIFLPESIDTNYFTPSERGLRRFSPGWAGGVTKKLKRAHLFDLMDFPIKIQSAHGREHFVQNRNQAHMKDFYNSIDCFVSVSETECLPRVILEAMACGLPVISTDVGGVRLLIPDEWLVPVNPESECVEEVNKRLAELSRNYELREGLGRINRAWCEKVWSWQANMPLWDEVFYYVKEGNKKKLEEIGESVLEPFQKFFEMTPQYEEQIKNFGTLKYESEKPVDPHKYDHTIANLIDDLHSYDGKYWFTYITALDVINHQRSIKKPGSVYLGTPTQKDKIQLAHHLIKLGAQGNDSVLDLKGLELKLMLEPEIKATKSMMFYGKAAPVPAPVIPYLSEMFGPLWRQK